MSILLESLSQQQRGTQAEKERIPDIHDTHFNDELMGDEILSQRLKVWQWLSGGLFFGLVVSWIFFYFSIEELTNSNASNIVGNDKNTSQIVQSNPVIIPDDTLNSNHSLDNHHQEKLATTVATNNTKTQSIYKPVKREKTVQSSRKNQVAKKTVNQKKETSEKSRLPITRNELSAELKEKFPDLIINSYVVAESAADSFVILDGAFYTINQVIAPDLVLRSISNQQIVVEFHSQLIKVPLK